MRRVRSFDIGDLEEVLVELLLLPDLRVFVLFELQLVEVTLLVQAKSHRFLGHFYNFVPIWLIPRHLDFVVALKQFFLSVCQSPCLRFIGQFGDA